MVYLDNAASTRPAPEATGALAQGAAEVWANPSSAHRLGAEASRRLDEARASVAALLRADAADLLLTSGGTEANAIGVLGAARAARGRHIVASAIEHPSVLRNVERLAAEGFEISLVAPGRDGVVAADAVVAVSRPDTALVAVMLVNHELGTVQPVAAIAAGLRTAGRTAHLHVDAVQAAPWLPIAVRSLGADSLALSGHKLHGPNGVGALWVRANARLAPLWDGGRQQRGLRSGTEDVPGAMALAAACALVRRDASAAEKTTALRDRFEELVADLVPEARPTVPAGTARAPHIASVRLDDLPAEPLLHALEAAGVYAAAGSACASRTRGPSPVLRAIGIDDRAAVLRFSLSRDTTEADVETAARALRSAVDEITEVARMPRRSRR